jgi:hypothetical protein
MSKAFHKSQKIPPACNFWFRDLNTLLVNLNAASSVDIPFLKACCSGTVVSMQMMA